MQEQNSIEVGIERKSVTDEVRAEDNSLPILMAIHVCDTNPPFENQRQKLTIYHYVSLRPEDLKCYRCNKTMCDYSNESSTCHQSVACFRPRAWQMF